MSIKILLMYLKSSYKEIDCYWCCRLLEWKSCKKEQLVSFSRVLLYFGIWYFPEPLLMAASLLCHNCWGTRHYKTHVYFGNNEIGMLWKNVTETIDV